MRNVSIAARSCGAQFPERVLPWSGGGVLRLSADGVRTRTNPKSRYRFSTGRDPPSHPLHLDGACRRALPRDGRPGSRSDRTAVRHAQTGQVWHTSMRMTASTTSLGDRRRESSARARNGRRRGHLPFRSRALTAVTDRATELAWVVRNGRMSSPEATRLGGRLAGAMPTWQETQRSIVRSLRNHNLPQPHIIGRCLCRPLDYAATAA